MAEEKAKERSLEVEQLRQKLAEQKGARASDKQLHFKLKELDHKLQETQLDPEQTVRELAVA